MSIFVHRSMYVECAFLCIDLCMLGNRSSLPFFVESLIWGYCLLKFTWQSIMNKPEYTATLVACGCAGAVVEKVTRASGQELYAQKTQKRRKSKKGIDQPTDGPT